MTSFASQQRNYLSYSVALVTCLMVLINISFKIIAIQGLMFTSNSVLCPLVAIIYLFCMQKHSIAEQRHILNQSLLALYLFSIGVYLLVNLPATEYRYDNIAYQIVYEDIPKKFFAATLAFALSFYLPHLIFYTKKHSIISPQKAILLTLLSGSSFFMINFFLLFSEPHAHSFYQIFLDSFMIAITILLLFGVISLLYLLRKKNKKTISKPTVNYLSHPFYSYLVIIAITMMLISLACEYRLVSFAGNWSLLASCILFPIPMLISGIIGELFGYRANLRLLVLLILAQLGFDLLLMIVIRLPSPAFFNLNPFYSLILPKRIPIASMALLISFFSITSFQEFFKKTNLISNPIFRIIFVYLIAASLLAVANYLFVFFNVYLVEQAFNLAMVGWIYKFAFVIICSPILRYFYQKSLRVIDGVRP